MVAKLSICASDVFHIFVNRQAEVSRLVEHIKNADRGNLGAILAEPDAGLSTALRQARITINERINVIPIDLSYDQPDALLVQTIQYILDRGKDFSEKILLRLARPGKKEIVRKLVSSSARAIPIVGSPISQLTEIVYNLISPDTGYLQYNRTLSELYELLSNNAKTCIIADHFQSAQTNHLTQIANTLNSVPGLAVIAAQNTKGQRPSTQVTSNILQPYLGEIENFPSPDPALAQLIIAKISRSTGITLHASQLPDIRDGLHAFLSGIFQFLTVGTRQPQHLAQVHYDILCLLGTGGSPLSVSIVFHALVQGRLFILDSEEFLRELTVLEDRGFVEINRSTPLDVSIALTNQGRSFAQRLLTSGHADLLFSQILYSGLVNLIENDKANEARFAALLYRLAGLVDQDGQKRWRMATIKSCIATSSFLEATALLDRIANDLQSTDDDDKLTLISVMSTAKKYQQALGICESISHKSTNTMILNAIFLYRNLRLETAYAEMKALLPIVSHLDEKCILAVYYIALCIDRGDIDSPAMELIESHENFRNTKHYGYLLNIIAATQTAADAIETCMRSFEFFRSRDDRFGLGGAWANLGVHRIKNRQYSESLTASDTAYGHLALFGIQHVHLVANNLASASIMLADLDNAKRWVRKSLDLLQTSTIRINTLTNLAALAFLDGRPDALASAIESAGRQAQEQPIVNVRQKFCRNARLLCEGMIDLPESVKQMCSETAQRFADDYVPASPGPDASQEDRLNYLRRHYAVPTNQYWYPNPMDLFKGKSLSVEAFR